MLVDHLLKTKKEFKNLSVDDMKKTGVKVYVYYFNVDYDDIAVFNILYIYKYLMKKELNSIKMFGLIEKVLFKGLVFLSTLTSVNLLSCILMNNQECKVRPQIVKLNMDKPVFFTF